MSAAGGTTPRGGGAGESPPRPAGRGDRSWTGAGGDAQAVRRRQLVLFSVIAAAVLVVLAAWLAAGGGAGPAPSGGIEAELAGPDVPEMVWTRRSEARFGAIETRLREMQGDARRLAAENERLRRRLAGDAEDARSVIDTQKAAIDELERRLRAVLPPDGAPGAEPGADPYFRVPGTPPSAGQAAPAPLAPAPLIETFELEGALESAPGPRSGAEIVAGALEKPLAGWLPAGAHAEAVVLAGVDASAGVSSQGDPRPVLFRITGPAWTAADGATALRVDIAGCTVTGAAHGDLSSEKVYARLRTMTCAASGPGESSVIETEVAGFVAGSGKTGVRGPVVSREGALVEKAFLAGLVSGVGQGVAGAFQPQAVATGGGAAVANTSLGDIGRAGLGAGASSAGQKVADYMIRRAEQYQPVIQLRAGTRVTLVFLEGARIDGRAVKSTQGGQ